MGNAREAQAPTFDMRVMRVFVWGLPHACHNHNPVPQHGVRLPTHEFLAAMAEAAVDIRHLSCRKSLVLLGMANEEALNKTVPVFLMSLR